MKKYILGFIIGIIVSSSVVFAANYLYQANEVSFSSDNIEWDVDNVDDALKDLYSRVSDSTGALTSLKNTDIAKAVGANGNDFSSVINKLGTIVNQGNKSFTVSGTSSITIPAGYYNGTGSITTSGLMAIPTGSKSITANGSNIDVKNYATVNVNVANSNSGTYTPSAHGTALDMGVNNTYRYVNTTNVYNQGYNNGKASVSIIVPLSVRANHTINSNATSITITYFNTSTNRKETYSTTVYGSTAQFAKGSWTVTAAGVSYSISITESGYWTTLSVSTKTSTGIALSGSASANIDNSSYPFNITANLG